ncbi:unnamed protein product [Alopecurus aequalis]
MMNLQPPAVSAPPSVTASPSPIGGGGAALGNGRSMKSAEQLVLDLCDPELREDALSELSKKRETLQDMLAPLLWYSYGTIAALLQEIVSIYHALSPPTLTPNASNRVCNVLALFQCVASHPETRMLFLEANIPRFLYPFLQTESNTRPFEYLRLTSLGVIGALVKVDNTKVITYLLDTEIVPLCMRCMDADRGSELSKTVATFIIQKILHDDFGLFHMCVTAERLFSLGRLLARMVVLHPLHTRLVKHIIRCFRRLSDDPRACVALQTLLPDVLKDGTVDGFLVDDPATRRWLQQLLHNVRVTVEAVGGAPKPGLDHMCSLV